MAAHFFDTVENSVTGKPVRNASIRILDGTGTTTVTIYSDDGTTVVADSTLLTDDTGYYEFWTEETSVAIEISYDGEVRRLITDVDLVGGSVSGDVTALAVRMDAAEVITQDATIVAFKGLAGTVGKYPYFTGTDTMALADVPTPGDVGNGLASGGIVAWESGLTFRISAASYYIGGVLYTSAEQTVTLTAADGSNPRIDVLYLDTAGLFGKVTGTAAASPSEPDIDPSTQLKRTFVLVGTSVSAPAGVSNENIYLENTEWTGTSSGSGWTLASTTTPYAGTKNIVAAAVAANGYVSYDHGAAITLTSYDVVSMFIKPTVAFPSGRVLRAQWYNNGVAIGSPITIAAGYWGFNSATLSFQFVAIPMANFVLPGGTQGDQLRITVVGGALSFQIDNIILQVQGTSIPQTSPGYITQAQGDARYALRGLATVSNITMATARLLGRSTASTGAIEEITVGSGLTLSAGSLTTSYIFSWFFTSVPTASEVLMLHVAGAAFTIPANFTAGLQSSIGTNPTATFALDIQKNGSTIGTISVSTGGAVTATTVSGTSKSIAAGDILKVVAPGSADATAANMAFTVIGAR